MVNTIFAQGRETAFVIGVGLQPFLDVYTNFDVFLLNLVTEGDDGLHTIPAFARSRLLKIPLKNGQGFIRAEGQNDVDRGVIQIRIQHDIGKYPIIKGFSFFFSSPYAFGYKQVLGYTYFGQLTDPNVNLWGDGYANMYVAGVLIESLAAMLALWLLDSVSRGLDVRLVVLACSFQLINLTNGGIFPILLGNGFLLLLLILALYPRDPPSAGVEEAPDGPPLTG